MQLSIDPILNTFEPVSLEEMDHVRLMNRWDTKFALSAVRLPEILESLTNDYRILVIGKARAHPYESLYFDTDNFRMYTDHHSGKASRYKIRARKYVETNLRFLEIKFKNNKGRTIKSRSPFQESAETLNEPLKHFLEEKSGFKAADLSPKLLSSYTRITLVSKHSQERLTIDTNLQFKNEKVDIRMPKLVILEVKQAEFRSSAIMRTMKQMRIREGSVSKYCLGVMQLYNDLKKNNFKPEMLGIHKINDEISI
jgi:hypothetical protein